MKKRKSAIIILYSLLMFALLVSCDLISGPDEVVEDVEIEEEGLARNGSYINEASELLAIGELELALSYFEQAIHDGQELPLAWRGVGMIRFMQNEFGEARVALETALALGGESTAIIYNMLGVASMRTLDFEQAIDYFDTGIVWFHLSLERAGGSLTEMIYGSPTEQQIEGLSLDVLQSMMQNRILSHQNLGNWEEARELARAYLLVFPDDAMIQREYEFLQTR